MPSGLYRVKTVNGTKQFQAFSGTQVPSFPSVPVGAILAMYTTTVPTGYLPCNGAEYDTEQFPLLYSVLGTNKLPDLRECVLVGSGTNTEDDIAEHDVYAINQFKDDQMQGHYHEDPGHTHDLIGQLNRNTDSWNGQSYVAGTWNVGGTASLTDYAKLHTTGMRGPATDSINGTPRTGATNHGKQKGVYYIIKATSAINDAESNAEISNAIAVAAEGLKDVIGYSTLPVGTVITMSDNRVTPANYVKCDGSAFDGSKYPMLVKYLGDAKSPLIYDEASLPATPQIAMENRTDYRPQNVEYMSTVQAGLENHSLTSTGDGFAADGYLYIETYHWQYIWIQDVDNSIKGYMIASRDDTQANLWLPIKKGQKVYGMNRNGAGSPTPSTTFNDYIYTKIYVFYFERFKYIKAVTGVEDNTEESEAVVNAIADAEAIMETEYKTQLKTIAASSSDFADFKTRMAAW